MWETKEEEEKKNIVTLHDELHEQSALQRTFLRPEGPNDPTRRRRLGGRLGEEEQHIPERHESGGA